MQITLKERLVDQIDFIVNGQLFRNLVDIRISEESEVVYAYGNRVPTVAELCIEVELFYENASRRIFHPSVCYDVVIIWRPRLHAFHATSCKCILATMDCAFRAGSREFVIEGPVGPIHHRYEFRGRYVTIEPPPSNGGQACDMINGPCSCGAWHP